MQQKQTQRLDANTAKRVKTESKIFDLFDITQDAESLSEFEDCLNTIPKEWAVCTISIAREFNEDQSEHKCYLAISRILAGHVSTLRIPLFNKVQVMKLEKLTSFKRKPICIVL